MSAREIVDALGGRWHGSYGMAPCPAHEDGREPALKVRDDERKRDGVDLHCFAGCAWQDVKAALHDRHLIEEWSSSPVTTARRRDPCKRRPTAPPGEVDSGRTEAAFAMWKKATPAAGTVVEAYLRARAITIEIPPTIRYLAGAKHTPTGLILPAMIAAVQASDRHIVGIHRTFLRLDGTGKASVSSARMMLGRCAGGAVRLGPVAHQLGIAEGLETALSVAQMHPGLSVWAALSAPGIVAIALPREVREVTIFADGDDAGANAAAKLAHRLSAEGRSVNIEASPAGIDFNDVLRGST